MSELQEPTPTTMSDEVASAWAEVLLDVYERLEAEKGSLPETTSQVTAGQDVPGGDLTSQPQTEEQPCFSN